MRGLTGDGLLLQFAVGGVLVGRTLVVEQSILVVVMGDHRAVEMGAVAVGVIAVAGRDNAVTFDFDQASGGVVAVVEGVGDRRLDLPLLGDAAQFVMSRTRNAAG